jgi:hypothetical protein
VLRNCILRDAYQQLVKVSVDRDNTSISSDGGLIENCVLEYSAGAGPNFYIGGIDALGAKNWTIRGNTLRNIASPHTAVGGFAIHFWSGSESNVVERNTIIDCDRGIGFGLDDAPNIGGVIRNNMIYHAANGAPFGDVGIAVTDSPDSRVYNNTIFVEHPYPNAIEYRFPGTRNVMIFNNLTNRRIQSRDGGSGTTRGNVSSATATWFVSPANGNLRLASVVPAVIDAGQPIADLIDDIDGEMRPEGTALDVGADEVTGQQRSLQLSRGPPASVD